MRVLLIALIAAISYAQTEMWSEWQDSWNCDDEGNGEISRTRYCPKSYGEQRTDWDACGGVEANSIDSLPCTTDTSTEIPCPISADQGYHTCDTFCDKSSSTCDSSGSERVPRNDYDASTFECPEYYFHCTDGPRGECCDLDSDCECSGSCQDRSTDSPQQVYRDDCVKEPLSYVAGNCPVGSQYCELNGLQFCSRKDQCNEFSRDCEWTQGLTDEQKVGTDVCGFAPSDVDETDCPWPYTLIDGRFCSLTGETTFYPSWQHGGCSRGSPWEESNFPSDQYKCSTATNNPTCTVNGQELTGVCERNTGYVDPANGPTSYYCCDGYCSVWGDCSGSHECGVGDPSFECVYPMESLTMDTCPNIPSENIYEHNGNKLDCGDCILLVGPNHEAPTCEKFCETGNYACIGGWFMDDWETCGGKGASVTCDFRWDLLNEVEWTTDPKRFCQCDPDTPAGTISPLDGYSINLREMTFEYTQQNERKNTLTGATQIYFPDLDTCYNQYMVSCDTPGTLTKKEYSNAECSGTPDSTKPYVYMERYKNDASDDFFIFPSWGDVCQPADPPMIQQMCTNSADWNSFESSPSEHDCNQSGCCTVTELVTGYDICEPTGGKTIADCTIYANINYREYSSEAECEYEHSDIVNWYFETSTGQQNEYEMGSIYLVVECDTTTGMTENIFYTDNSFETESHRDLAYSNSCTPSGAGNGNYVRYSWDNNYFCPMPSSVDITFETYSDDSCTGSPDSTTTTTYNFDSYGSDDSEALGGDYTNGYYILCGKYIGWLNVASCSSPGMCDMSEARGTHPYGKCLDGTKVTWSGPCAPRSQEEIDAIGNVVMDFQEQTYHPGGDYCSCDTGNCELNSQITVDGSCTPQDGESQRWTCVYPGLLKFEHYTDLNCVTKDDAASMTYKSGEEIKDSNSNMCYKAEWSGFCQSNDNTNYYQSTGVCNEGDSWDSRSSELECADDGTLNVLQYVSTDCSGEPYEYATLQPGCNYGQNGGFAECLDEAAIYNSEGGQCGKNEIIREVYTSDDCSVLSTTYNGVLFDGCTPGDMPGVTSASNDLQYWGFNCEQPDGQYQMKIFKFDDEYDCDKSEHKWSGMSLTYDQCMEDPFETGTYVKYRWNGDCTSPGDSGSDVSRQKFSDGDGSGFNGCIEKDDGCLWIEKFDEDWGSWAYHKRFTHGGGCSCPDGYDPSSDTLCSDDCDEYDLKVVIIDEIYCNAHWNNLRCWEYQDEEHKDGMEVTVNGVACRGAYATEDCNRSQICDFNWVENLPDQYNVRSLCSNLDYTDRASVCGCLDPLFSRIGDPDCHTYDNSLTFAQLNEYFQCTGYDCQTGDDDTAFATWATDECDDDDHGSAVCAATTCSQVGASYCDENNFYHAPIRRYCPVTCGICQYNGDTVPSEQPSVFPTYAPQAMKRCDEPEEEDDYDLLFYCGDGGCMPREDNDCILGCGTPWYPADVKGCCVDSYCTCNADKTVCDCQKDGKSRTCNGSPYTPVPTECSHGDMVTTCPNISGKKDLGNAAGATEDAWGTDVNAGVIQNGCCFTIFSANFFGTDVQAYFTTETTGTLMFGDETRDFKVSTVDGVDLLRAEGYTYYPEGFDPVEFEIDCKDPHVLQCNADCIDCMDCGIGTAPDGFDCGDECGHCQPCAQYTECFDLLTWGGESGLNCTTEQPLECLDTCYDCNPCAENLDCFELIGDETCYTGDAVDCLSCHDCVDCYENSVDNPIEGCEQCEATCGHCKPFKHCWDIIVALGEDGERCTSDFSLNCLDTCLECEPCAPWMYCLDIFDGTPMSCDKIVEETACDEYELDDESCSWDGESCSSAYSVIRDEDICVLFDADWDDSLKQCSAADPTEITCPGSDTWWNDDEYAEVCPGESCLFKISHIDDIDEPKSCGKYCEYYNRDCVNSWSAMGGCGKAGYKPCDFPWGEYTEEVYCQCGELTREYYPFIDIEYFSLYPGYAGSLDITGHVSLNKTVAHSGIMEMKLMLAGVDSACATAPSDNPCSITLHDGFSCASVDTIGSEYAEIDFTTGNDEIAMIDFTGGDSSALEAIISDYEQDDGVTPHTLVIRDGNGDGVACQTVGGYEILREVTVNSAALTIGFFDLHAYVVGDLGACSATSDADSCKLKIIQADSCSDDLSTVLVEGVYDGESTIDGQFPDDAGMAVRWRNELVLEVYDSSGSVLDCTALIGQLTKSPTKMPTRASEATTNSPTLEPTLPDGQTKSPTAEPSMNPTMNPSTNPTSSPSKFPSVNPTEDPVCNPTKDPTMSPTSPTMGPSMSPTSDPSTHPSASPSMNPTINPTAEPTVDPTLSPTRPTVEPSMAPTSHPSTNPSASPSVNPTINPTAEPTVDPTMNPSSNPSVDPTKGPSMSPTTKPTNSPTESPTEQASKRLTTTVKMSGVSDCNAALPSVKTATANTLGLSEGKITVTPGTGCPGVNSSNRRFLQDEVEFDIQIDGTEEEIAAVETQVQDETTFTNTLNTEIDNVVAAASDSNNHPLANATVAEVSAPVTVTINSDSGSDGDDFPVWIIIVIAVVAVGGIGAVIYYMTQTGGENNKDQSVGGSEMDMELGDLNGTAESEKRKIGKKTYTQSEQELGITNNIKGSKDALE